MGVGCGMMGGRGGGSRCLWLPTLRLAGLLTSFLSSLPHGGGLGQLIDLSFLQKVRRLWVPASLSTP